MGWSIGYDDNWRRDIGYGVPCQCDHPNCRRRIHRGLAYVCGGEPYGGEQGCGLFFCAKHLMLGVEGKDRQVCERCSEGKAPFDPKPDVNAWLRHKLKNSTWATWRDENPKEVETMLRTIEARRRPRGAL